MKRIFEKLGLHKMDEMEQHILFKAQRNAYLFLVIALMVWSFYESAQVYLHHSRLNLLPSLLLTAAVLIQSFSQLVLRRNAVKDDEDSCETGPLVKLVLLACVIAALAVTAAAANAATDGMLLNGIMFHILSMDENRMELMDDEGNRFFVTAVDGDLVREEDGRVYIQTDSGDVDITDSLLENGSYTFECELNTAIENGGLERGAMEVKITGVPGDLTVSQKSVDGEGNVTVYAVAGEHREDGDGETFVTVSGSYVAEDGSVQSVETETRSSAAADVEE